MSNFITDVAAQVLERLAADTITTLLNSILSVGVDGVLNALKSGASSDAGISQFTDALENYGIDTSQISPDDWETLASIIADMVASHS